MINNFQEEKKISNRNVDFNRNAIIYSAVLSDFYSFLPKFSEILSEDEIERANRFHYKKHREKYITSRGILRLLLANFLDQNAQNIKFIYGPFGKPYLARYREKNKLFFNIAHSEDMAIFGFLQSLEIGVDIEYMRPISELEQVASNYFSENEKQDLFSLPQNERLVGFYNCWTRKEAFLKAEGGGLSTPLDSFNVTLIPGKPVRILSIEGSNFLASEWTLISFTENDTYVGAMAFKGKNIKYNIEKLTPESGLLNI